MSNQETTVNSIASSTKMLRSMVGIGTLCALLIVLTFEGTLPRIERLKAEALQKALFKVIPNTTQTKTFQIDENGITEVSGLDKSMSLIYVGYNESEELTGVAIEASGQGYADILRILYGYDPGTQTIIGFHVLESKETPGLGDKIEKDPHFLFNFIALDVTLGEDGNLIHPVTTVKQGTKENPWEIDGITGATISSRAIGEIIFASTSKLLPLISEHQEVFNNPIVGEEK